MQLVGPLINSARSAERLNKTELMRGERRAAGRLPVVIVCLLLSSGENRYVVWM